jgi:hypothetical protein
MFLKANVKSIGVLKAKGKKTNKTLTIHCSGFQEAYGVAAVWRRKRGGGRKAVRNG